MSLFSIANKAAEAGKKRLFPSGFPACYQCKQLFNILSLKEKLGLLLLSVTFVGSTIFLGASWYNNHTETVPAIGGEYIEGEVGQPRFINPIYGVLNDVDRDLVQLLFAGLMNYNENGKMVPDLAEEYQVLEDGRVFEIYLKDNLFWSDGEKLTVDDVIFTIETIQDPDYKSPLRINWLGVEAKRISETGIRFTLNTPYASFPENLTLKILPRHIWENIPSQNFPLSSYNLLKLVGSGPYQIEKLDRNEEGYTKSIKLINNSRYHGKQPNIQRMIFRFFSSEEEMLKAAKLKEINGLSVTAPKDYATMENFGFRSVRFLMPRYFAVFFNPAKSEVLNSEGVRKAFNYGTDKEAIKKEVLKGESEIVSSPILPEVYGFSSPAVNYAFQPDSAKEFLDKAGYVLTDSGARERTIKEEIIFQFKSELKTGSQGEEVRKLQECLANPSVGGADIFPEAKITGFFGTDTKNAVIKFQEKYAADILTPQNMKNGTGTVSKATRQKLNDLCGKKPAKTVPLSFVLTTVEQPLMIEVAQNLKKQWQALGASVEIKTVTIESLERDVIKPREYEALLFGEVLGMIPDPFPFWHSSQKKDPGLNLAAYDNKDADKLLEEARETLDQEIRKQKLEEFQNILLESAPAVFLYSPDYIYFVSSDLKGINQTTIADPSKRFGGVENWYIKTQRKWREK